MDSVQFRRFSVSIIPSLEQFAENLRCPKYSVEPMLKVCTHFCWWKQDSMPSGLWWLKCFFSTLAGRKNVEKVFLKCCFHYHQFFPTSDNKGFISTRVSYCWETHKIQTSFSWIFFTVLYSRFRSPCRNWWGGPFGVRSDWVIGALIFTKHVL